MTTSLVLPAFTPAERNKAHALLAARVAYMMGRKFEEADWAEVYCGAKGIAVPQWSNLNVDIEVPGLAIEHKMVKRSETQPVRDCCGTWLMHPALTRQISLPSGEDDPNKAMLKIISDYQRVLDLRRERTEKISGGKSVEMRSGWLVYQSDLREFLYFEEHTRNLDPKEHYAEWSERGGKGGTRRSSRNLWIFNSKTKQKIWAVTGPGSGTKIQPYFFVPPTDDPNLYYFRVQGELDGQFVKVWVTLPTYAALKKVIKDLSPEALSKAILDATPIDAADVGAIPAGAVEVLRITVEAYEKLQNGFAGVSDEHSFQLLIQQLTA
jgi:hypothetical protein